MREYEDERNRDDEDREIERDFLSVYNMGFNREMGEMAELTFLQGGYPDTLYDGAFEIY